MYIIGHRGNSATAPENTMAAFSAAHALGASGIELDVALSRDSQVVVFHDTVLDRTTNGHGPFAAADWDQLRNLDAGSWFSARFAGEKIPLLEDVFAQFRDTFALYIVELKGSPQQSITLVTKVIALIQKYHLESRVQLMVTDKQLIEVITQLGKGTIRIQFFTGLYIHPIPLMFRVEFNFVPKTRIVGLNVYPETIRHLNDITAFSLDYLLTPGLIRHTKHLNKELYLGARIKISHNQAEKLRDLGLTGIMRNDVTPLRDLQ